MSDFVHNVKKEGRRWYGQFIYELSYNPEENKYTCECPGFCFRGWCKHLKEFKDEIRSELLEEQNDKE